MKLIDFELDTIDIRLTATVATGRGAIGDRSGLVLRLRGDEGRVGHGEASPLPGTEPGRLEPMASAVRSWAASAVGGDVETVLGELDSSSLAPEPRFAVHTALVDLVSQDAGVPLSNWLRSSASPVVHVNALVADETPADVHAAVSRYVASGFRSIKLKVGVSDTSLDATRIIAASEAAGSDTELRLDANGSWDRESVDRVVGRVGRHRVSYIEDPTADISEFASIEADTGVRMAIDLPVGDLTDARRALQQSGASVVVVKPVAIGGVDRIMDLRRLADADTTIVVTSSIDHDVALCAAMHVAAAMPANGVVAHGLATGPLVRGVDETLHPVHGRVTVPNGSGVAVSTRVSGATA